MNKKVGKVFVWPICSRIIHWTIALSFTLAFVTSFYPHWLTYHVSLGYLFMVMLIFRIVWGFIGPRYATFNTFKLNLKDLQWYFIEKVKDRWRKIPPGHNPASSWYTLLVLGIGMIINLTGLLLYGVQEGRGLFAYLNEDYFYTMVFLDYAHIIFAYFLAVWAVIHIMGVLIEQFYHKTSMFFAMVTGYKKSQGQDTELCPIKHFIAFVFIFLSLGTFYYLIHNNTSFLIATKNIPVDYKTQLPEFYDDCSKCHKIYPPFMLPERSWNRLMDGIDNHFGEKITEANISKENQSLIRNFLITNAAEYATNKLAYRLIISLEEDERPKSITKTDYWRNAHNKIDPAVFKDKKIKDPSNCFACHKDFDKGLIDDINIIFHN